MVASKYSRDIHKVSKISFGTAMRNPQMLKFVSGTLKLKPM